MRKARAALAVLTLCVFTSALAAALLWPSQLTELLLIAAFGFLFAVWTVQAIVRDLNPRLRLPSLRRPR